MTALTCACGKPVDPAEITEKIKKDLIDMADRSENEELRLAVLKYFEKQTYNWGKDGAVGKGGWQGCGIGNGGIVCR